MLYRFFFLSLCISGHTRFLWAAYSTSYAQSSSSASIGIPIEQDLQVAYHQLSDESAAHFGSLRSLSASSFTSMTAASLSLQRFSEDIGAEMCSSSSLVSSSNALAGMEICDQATTAYAHPCISFEKMAQPETIELLIKYKEHKPNPESTRLKNTIISAHDVTIYPSFDAANASADKSLPSNSTSAPLLDSLKRLRSILSDRIPTNSENDWILTMPQPGSLRLAHDSASCGTEIHYILFPLAQLNKSPKMSCRNVQQLAITLPIDGYPSGRIVARCTDGVVHIFDPEKTQHLCTFRAEGCQSLATFYTRLKKEETAPVHTYIASAAQSVLNIYELDQVLQSPLIKHVLHFDIGRRTIFRALGTFKRRFQNNARDTDGIVGLLTHLERDFCFSLRFCALLNKTDFKPHIAIELLPKTDTTARDLTALCSQALIVHLGDESQKIVLKPHSELPIRIPQPFITFPLNLVFESYQQTYPEITKSLNEYLVFRRIITENGKAFWECYYNEKPIPLVTLPDKKIAIAWKDNIILISTDPSYEWLCRNLYGVISCLPHTLTKLIRSYL